MSYTTARMGSVFLPAMVEHKTRHSLSRFHAYGTVYRKLLRYAAIIADLYKETENQIMSASLNWRFIEWSLFT